MNSTSSTSTTSKILRQSASMAEDSAGKMSLELSDLPDSLLLEVCFFLSAQDLGRLACTSSRFNCIASDDLLWKGVFRQHFKVPHSVPIQPRASSWRCEYQRLWDESPAVLSEVLTKHKDQVLHVSFSHNGQMFATCSKDGKVMVWSTTFPTTLRFSANLSKEFSWRYTQYSQFNMADTLLLVSGVFHGNLTTSGEIAVFDLQEFEPQCRVINKPYDVFGCWYDNHHLFSGSLYWTGHLQSISALWLNKASQAVESERESVMMNLYRFSNVNASSIRTIMVADVPVASEERDTTPSPTDYTMDVDCGIYVCGKRGEATECVCGEGNTNNSCWSLDSDSGCVEVVQGWEGHSRGVECEAGFHTNSLTASCDGHYKITVESARVHDGCVDRPQNEDRMENINGPGNEDASRPRNEDSMDIVGESRNEAIMENISQPQNEDRIENVSRPQNEDSMQNISQPQNEDSMENNSWARNEDSMENISWPLNEDCMEGVHGKSHLTSQRTLMSDRQTAGAEAEDTDSTWGANNELKPSTATINTHHHRHGDDRQGLSVTVETHSSCSSAAAGRCSQSSHNASSSVEVHREGYDHVQGAIGASMGHTRGAVSASAGQHNESSIRGQSLVSASTGHVRSAVNANTGHVGSAVDASAEQHSQGSSHTHSAKQNSDLGMPPDSLKHPSSPPKGAAVCHASDSSQQNSKEGMQSDSLKHPSSLPKGAALCHTADSSPEESGTGASGMSVAAAQSPKHMSDIPRTSSAVNLVKGKSVRTQKLLIFTMGEETYTPHLIGIKRMRLQDIRGEEGEWVEGAENLLPNVAHNMQGMDRPPTTVDHTINMHGHIVGMALSPDQRYLYVNSRQWPQNYYIDKVLEPPPIAQEIDIHVIDLVTFQEVGTIMRSHKAFTPNDECFFLFLDVSELYVASGAEDKRGYLWDRHYGIHLHCFPHTDVVNSVAFNPSDQEMLVTVSDDNKIKVWRSRRRRRELGSGVDESCAP